MKKTISTGPFLEMRGIGKRFPGVIALDQVDFHLHAGEVVALVGENGAGKSTLMKILGGILSPDSGEILIEGRPVAIDSVSQAMALGIGLIHQELNVLDNLDVAGNVFLGREPVREGWRKPFRTIDRARMNAETERVLHRLGLEIPPETPLDRLTIAQQQLVEIAKALSLDARLLIMDEPTSSLTTVETSTLLALIRELRDHGVGIIYISHRLGEVAEIADRVVVLRDGRNAGALERDQINHDRMVQLMVGRELRHEYRPPTHSMSNDYFVVEGLVTSKYPHHTLTFSVAKGEILGFAGLIGAGRSEMAQAIFGVDRKLAGRISLAGREIRIDSTRNAIREGIFLIPEDRRQAGLVVERAVRENVTLPALSSYATRGWIDLAREKQVAQRLCADLKVKAASIEDPVSSLSGGNQQKVVLAKWLQREPKVMIFDEPTRGIDVGAKAEFYALMRGLAAKGVAIIVVSSEMEEILGLADRIAVMHEGEITGILERRDCTEEKVMRLAVGGNAKGRKVDFIGHRIDNPSA